MRKWPKGCFSFLGRLFEKRAVAEDSVTARLLWVA